MGWNLELYLTLFFFFELENITYKFKIFNSSILGVSFNNLPNFINYCKINLSNSDVHNNCGANF